MLLKINFNAVNWMIPDNFSYSTASSTTIQITGGKHIPAILYNFLLTANSPHGKWEDFNLRSTKRAITHFEKEWWPGPRVHTSVYGINTDRTRRKLFYHSNLHMTACGFSLHKGSTKSRKTLEQHLIFQNGTLNPKLFSCFSLYHAPTNRVAPSFRI